MAVVMVRVEVVLVGVDGDGGGAVEGGVVG